MFKQDWVEWIPSIWGTKIEISPDFAEMLRGGKMDDDARARVSTAIEQEGRSADIVPLPSLGEGIEFIGFDWSTSMDFGHEYDGGGYLLLFGHEYFEDQYGLPSPLMAVRVESDSYSDEMGYDRGQEASVEIALDVLEEFLSTL